MAIARRYFRYLEHCGPTVPVSALLGAPAGRRMVALRHDIDHDLDAALEMACWEHRLGARATYFVLPGSAYWGDPDLVDKCLQIQDFGHEVGVHLNALADWYAARVDDPGESLLLTLSRLRGAGLHIAGGSTHGDGLCYSGQFINYWLFAELRPDDPLASESGLSAEGTPSNGARGGVAYPASHSLVRADGRELPLWSVSMADMGLDYEAMHLPCDRYYTDSGGEWTRSPDPLGEPLDRGRYQINMHPEYWRGQQKLYFFLSTARSGSKWLSSVLDKASSAASRHEFMLNHRLQDGQPVEDKHTADGFVELQDAPGKALELLAGLRPWVENLGRDYAEVNVYLESFIDEVQETYPEAKLVHLHRRPSDVVASVMNRDWYDTPEDDRHPRQGVEGWGGMGQFRRACWYVRCVNERLAGRCALRLCFEKMVKGPDELERVLSLAGIAFYPRLAKGLQGRRINEGRRSEFPAYAGWSRARRAKYHAICDEVNRLLGYPERSLVMTLAAMAARAVGALLHGGAYVRPDEGEAAPAQPLDVDIHAGQASPDMLVERDGKGLRFVPPQGRNGYYLLGGGAWHNAAPGAGWEAQLAHYYRGDLRCTIAGGGSARLFCLLYAQDGAAIGKRPLVRLRHGKTDYHFSFRPGSGTATFNLALYMPGGDLPGELRLESLALSMLPLGQEE